MAPGQPRIAIIGGGNIGSRLGRRFADAGYEMTFGVRKPSEAAAALSATGRVVAPAAAAASAEVILLAVPANAAVGAARELGPLTGKVVLDCTNPLRWDSGPVWAPPPEGSMAAALAAALPGVSVVKGFNYFGAEVHGDPRMTGGPADAFFAGDDAGAKQTIMTVAERSGFRPFDAGPLRNAALLENLAVLWIQLAGAGVGRHFAFRVDRK